MPPIPIEFDDKLDREFGDLESSPFFNMIHAMKKKMTIEDLAEIIERTVAKKEDIAGVNERLDRVEQDITVMKSDIWNIKSDIVNIKSDTAYLKARVSEIGNQEIEELKERVTVLEVKSGVKRR